LHHLSLTQEFEINWQLYIKNVFGFFLSLFLKIIKPPVLVRVVTRKILFKLYNYHINKLSPTLKKIDTKEIDFPDLV